MTVLNDGYGDDLTPSEVISQYERWLHAVANRLLPPDDHRHDDLVQEGRIGMWKALKKYDPTKGALPSYLTRGAEMQIRDSYIRGENWTGSPSRRGYTGPVQITKVLSLDAALQDSSSVHDETAGGVTEDFADAAALAHHRKEIAAALAALTDKQRQYIALRFVHGLSNTEASRRLGASPNTLWNAPRGGAKHKLRTHLSHLEAA